MKNITQIVDLPMEIIDVIKSFLPWKAQLKLNFSRKEQFGSSLFEGAVHHQEALVYYIQKKKLKLVHDILMDPRRYPLPHEFPFGAKFRGLIFMDGSIQHDHLEIVKLLLSHDRIDPSAKNNHAIRWASEHGHLDVVKLLLSDARVDPAADDNYAIRWASHYGHLEVVKLLLSDTRVDPSTGINCAIRWASFNGHQEVVKLLLSDERVDPSVVCNL